MPVQGGEVAQVTGPIKDPFTYYITADGIFYSAPVDTGIPSDLWMLALTRPVP